MGKKGFTLVEVLAVIVIIAVIASIATLNITKLSDSSRRADYVSDAKVFVSKAKYMYNNEDYHKSDSCGSNPCFTSNNNNVGDIQILLADIIGINDYSDPFGGYYDVKKSFVSFREDGVYITLVSCEKSDSSELYNSDSCSVDNKSKYHSFCDIKFDDLSSSVISENYCSIVPFNSSQESVVKNEIPYYLYKSASCSDDTKSSITYTSNSWACNTVHLYVSDYSNYTDLKYSVDGGSLISMSNGVGIVSAEGNHSVVISGKNNDNKSVSSTINNIKIDKTPPTLNLSRTRSGNTFGDTWTNGSVTLTATFSDSGGSGLSTLYRSSRSSGCATGSANISSLSSKAYTYSKPSSDRNCNQNFYVTDNAGNQSTEKYLAVRQDVTGPTCSGSERDGTVSGNINYEYTFTDSGTGVNKIEYGHCYNSSIGSINNDDRCSTSDAINRMGRAYIWSSPASSHSKSYNYKYSEGLVYILFDVYDAVGNKTRCTRGTSPYKHTYAHCFNKVKAKTMVNFGASECRNYLG